MLQDHQSCTFYILPTVQILLSMETFTTDFNIKSDFRIVIT